jgi:hypothetical protein
LKTEWHSITLRFTASELQALTKAAETLGVAPATFARLLAWRASRAILRTAHEIDATPDDTALVRVMQSLFTFDR